MNKKISSNDDPRFQKIADMIIRYAAFDFSVRETVSEKGDELDAIITGLNTLGEELQAEFITDYKKRMNELIETMIRFSVLDFSQKAEIGTEGDEMDALAVGLNTLSEELESHVQQIKDSEEHIQTLFRVAPEAVIVIDEEGKITSWNPRAETIFGWTANEVIGKYLYEIIIPERFREAHQKGMQRFMKTKEGPVLNKPLELPAIRKDNMEFDAGISISPMVVKGRYFFVGFVSDISYRKKSEAIIAQKSEELLRSNKELEQFAYVASHDLQEPLRMVTSFLQLLEKQLGGELDKDSKEFLDFAVDGARRMKIMIDDLLVYSKMLTKKIVLEKTDIGKLLQNAIGNLQESISKSGAKIICGKMPVSSVDTIKTTRLFQNLIVNAIKFRKKNVAPVVEIYCEEHNGEHLFFVKDNGIGIKKIYYDKIFGIFQRLNAKEEYPGTGIGLAECKKIVELHGGKIWVESEEGKGATFCFTIKK